MRRVLLMVAVLCLTAIFLAPPLAAEDQAVQAIAAFILK